MPPEESNSPPPPSFVVRDCALAAIATGRRAHDLREFRDRLLDVPPECIYYHFWGTLLLPRFENPEYINDFAQWAYQSLRDKVLAERLAAVDPAVFIDMEQLRRELLEVVEERLDEVLARPQCPPDRPFHFVRSQIVVFDTGRSAGSVPELLEALRRMTVGSIFYHFIDARRRTEGMRDDFRPWLELFGEGRRALIDRLAGINPYFAPLYMLRQELVRAFEEEGLS